VNTTALVVRALRAFASLLAMIAIVTVGMSVVATAIPRSVDGFLTAGLRYDAQSVSAIARDVEARGTAELDFGAGAGAGMSEGASDTWGLFDDQAEALRDKQPQPLRDILGAPEYTAVTAPESVSLYVPDYVSLGYDPRFLSRVTLVEGDEPAIGPSTVPGEIPIEVISSEAVARALRWEVGGTYPIYLADRAEQWVVLTGLFEANDPDEPYWEHTTSTLEPTVVTTPRGSELNATVFANPAGFESLLSYPAPFALSSTLWYPVSPESLDVSDAGQLAQQVRKLSSASQQVGSLGTPAMMFRSDLPDLLETADARSTSSQAILATILAGPIGLAVAIEVLVARLVASRLRESLALLGARGASAGQRRLLLFAPTLAVGIVAAAIGVGLALLLPGGRIGTGGVVAIAAVAIAPAILLALFGAGPERTTRAPSGRLRLVAEGVVVLATAASVAAALQRGNRDGSGTGVDLLAAAVPLTLSLLGCIVTLRLYPLVLRRSLAVAHRRPGIDAFLGLARALRAGSAGLVPVLAVLIGVSVAVFSGVLSATLVAGTQTAAAGRVGADVAVDNVRLDPADLDAIKTIDGVAAAAGISIDLFHRLAPTNADDFQVTLVLVDPDEFIAAQSGVPGALDLPDGLTAADDGTVPLAVSAETAAVTGGEQVATLDRNGVTLLQPPLTSEIFNTSPRWVIGDVADAEALDFPSPVISKQALVRVDDGASIERVRADIIALVGPDAAVTTANDIATQRSANPAVGGILVATIFAIVGSALLSAAALALTIVVDGRPRAAALDLLATLGLGRRQARRSVVWELAPLSAVGLVVGTALGAVLSAVVLASVDLRPFTAGIEQPAATVDPLLMLAIVGGFVVLLVVAIGAAAVRAAPRPRASRRPADSGAV